MPRRRHDAGHGRADGGPHRNGRKEQGGSLGLTPNAIGRSCIAERGPNGPGCILSIVGRCIAHAPREASAIGNDHRGEIGWPARRWWMPHGVAKGGRRVGSARICRAPFGVDLQSRGGPPPSTLTEPGEWAHGWQFYTSSVSVHHFRKTVVLAHSCPSDQAHLRSHSGGGCSHVLQGCPTSPEFTVAPDVFHTIALERLRLPLPVTEARCDCGALTDSGPLARTQDDFARGQLHPRRHWPGSAGRLGQLFVRTLNSET